MLKHKLSSADTNFLVYFWVKIYWLDLIWVYKNGG